MKVRVFLRETETERTYENVGKIEHGSAGKQCGTYSIPFTELQDSQGNMIAWFPTSSIVFLEVLEEAVPDNNKG